MRRYGRRQRPTSGAAASSGGRYEENRQGDSRRVFACDLRRLSVAHELRSLHRCIRRSTPGVGVPPEHPKHGSRRRESNALPGGAEVGTRMKPTTIVFDIETVPSKTAYAHPDEVLRMAQKRGQKIDEFASLCPVLCSVIAVGILELETGTQHAHVCGGVDREFDVLTVVNAAINSAARLVTFNGRRFDLPALIHRSRINGVQPAGILLRSVLQKPSAPLPHVDMAHG